MVCESFPYLLQISLTAFPHLCCIFTWQYEEFSRSRQPRKYSYQDLFIRDTSHLKKKICKKEVSSCSYVTDVSIHYGSCAPAKLFDSSAINVVAPMNCFAHLVCLEIEVLLMVHNFISRSKRRVDNIPGLKDLNPEFKVQT